MKLPAITIDRRWNAEDVRLTCIRNKFYTRGNNQEYAKMLELVDGLLPTPENLYIVAKDICDHSKDQTISHIMFVLELEDVYTFYHIEGEDD
ncbi:MAG: hypothetical protein IKN72_03870 [Clostridia bacterium]|nr:hypothetical protein [Clostridia bacterium]